MLEWRKSLKTQRGFSLIELSIVLIIIGLLVAGITSGQSLIESAKVRSLMNEIREYETAVHVFRTKNDNRFPGDVKNLGTFGLYSNYDMDSSRALKPSYAYTADDFDYDFLTEFQKTAGNDVLPNHNSAPFVELYTEGILDFRPLGNTKTTDKNSTTKGIPNSKVLGNTEIGFIYSGTISEYTGTPCLGCKYYSGIKDFGSIKEIMYYFYRSATYQKGLEPKIIKDLDRKIDDGKNWNGIFRGACYGKNASGGADDTKHFYADYDYAIQNRKKCNYFYYAL